MKHNILISIVWQLLLLLDWQQALKVDEPRRFRLIPQIDSVNGHGTPENCPEMLEHKDLRNAEHEKLRDFIKLGHNGLRNRLAVKLKLCDVFSMHWEDDLAEMANRQHRQCKRKVPDKCICESGMPSKDVVLAEEDPKLEISLNETACNSHFLTNIYAWNYIELAIGSWYHEHSKMEEPPLINYEDEQYYNLTGHNAFVRMINPSSYQLGCSYALFEDGHSLICFYFPFSHASNGTFLLRSKPKEYQCPYNFPMRHELFKELCTYADYAKL
ncbi:uncharacterized protein LOC108595655 [Drosophila busckii]|uniref:uncharacterized protein LOC108595655 n=1 Tax=Drosophila busckii TaxID=30019 RepID=UPI00083EBB35|nr:uncharacterized protein LOC108595655 [Drosophila busckii]